MLSSAKANAATGINWTFEGEAGGICTFVDETFSQPVASFIVRMGYAGETIATAKLTEPTGQDLTIAGHAAFWGPTFHQLYVDLGGGSTLVILLVTTDNAVGLDLAQKLANAYFAQ